MSRNESKTKASVQKDEDPYLLLSNYIDCCKKLGIPPNDVIHDALTTAAVGNLNGGKQIILNFRNGESSDQRWKPKQKLGSLGCLALCSAIRGNVDGIQGVNPSKNSNVMKLLQIPSSTAASVSYKALKELRIWNGAIGDDGVISVSRLLLLGSPDIQLCFLEVISDDVGPNGAMALGRSLCCGMNSTLVTLILDFNIKLGSDGMKNLSRGLCTNSTLKKLSVKYCGIDQKGGDALAEILLFPKVGLLTLELGGNQLSAEGLHRICRGLAQNSSLTYFGISDNQIWGPRDEKTLSTFAAYIAKHPQLKEVNLLYNLLEEKGALALLPALDTVDNPRIEKFLIDETYVPRELFQRLYRNKVPTKKKASKKKKKGGGK